MTKRQVWLRIACTLFVVGLTGFVSNENVKSGVISVAKATSLCDYIKFDDPGTTFRRTLICDLPTDALGWGHWFDSPDPGDTCYDYRAPYCHMAEDPQAPAPDACTGERATMIAEYPQYGVTFRPFCHSFADNGGSANFSWNELNGGFQDGNPHTNGYWGIVRPGLTDGLEATRTAYNRGAILLTSGYRCPHGNASQTVKGAVQSLHMQGRAGDMYSAAHTWTETEFNLLRAAGNTTSPYESFTWATYTDRHYHASW